MSTQGGWPQGWRKSFWESLDASRLWDIVVIGGGISGAGILREAVRMGLSAVLVEQADFSSGTSSRSSKLVHGGLRYLATGDWRLTLESVRERQKLLADAPGLIQPQRLLVPIFAGQKPRSWEMRAGLTLYDGFARKRLCYALSADETARYTPGISTEGLQAAYSFQDADTDDARLVLRVLRDAQCHGGHAMNYVRVQELLREDGKVCGVSVEDRVLAETHALRCKAVINATGVWAEKFTTDAEHKNQIRPLRGSHLLVPQWRFPLGQGVSWQHHEDHRNVFVYPWANMALIGTTDLDHTQDLDCEPAHTADEARYLIDAVNQRFPSLKLTKSDVVSTYSGVRPVISSGHADPSAESRESALWVEPGLITLTGGKLTTFAVSARQALHAAAPYIGMQKPESHHARILDALPQTPPDKRLSPPALERLAGLYGADFPAILDQIDNDAFLEPIGATPHRWLELAEAAAHEAVQHLDDLLLRRTRLGLLLPSGARSFLPRIRALCQSLLGWSDSHWEAEEQRYIQLWKSAYAPPR